MIYQQIFEKYGRKGTVGIGIIGSGAYGTAIITQGILMPQIKIAAIADIDLSRAVDALHKAGIPTEKQIYCQTAEEAEKAISEGCFVYTDNSSIISQIGSVDIVCECTGNPEVTARHLLDAIEKGKHVAVITKDADACIGPILKRKADEKGLVYTPVDGDQHGLLIQMYTWAKKLGLEVICGGKATDGELIYDRKLSQVTLKTDKAIKAPYVQSAVISDEDRKYFDKIPAGKGMEYMKARQKALETLPPPGAYDLCEMTIAANYTGLTPQVETLFHVPMRISEIPEVYNLEKQGGILSQKDTLDLVTVLREPDESGLGGGVFLVVRSDNDYSNFVMATKGQIASQDESATVIYRPFHLCGVETPMSLLVAGLLGLNTASDDYFPHVQLAKKAARDIKAGEKFEGDHSIQMAPVILPYAPVAPGNYAEGHMLAGNTAAVDIPAGTLITYDMVVEPADSVLWALRREQDQTFA